ncbi:MAG: VWA domain-containing protein [Oscillospiraceae bacterium]|nr:VWA domain-containing protein [Oscillospiraceae bacterium]
MGIISSNKELSDDVIECGGSFKIKLSITAEPDISADPADIVLILDRSGSMAGSPLANLKSGARKFIDIIDESTDGAKNGHIGGGSRIGIVSFSDTAVQNTQLITSVNDLKDAVDSLRAGGRTNHRDAFEKALALFEPASTNEKIMIMFTDGVTTVGGSAVPVTDAAKAQGVVIYCIGLSGSGGIDVQALNDWASDPDSAYVTITPDDEELEKIFEDLAKNISKPGATDIVITDTVDPCFRITSVFAPTKGKAMITSDTSVKWEIDELGVHSSEGAFLEFEVRHVGSCSGLAEVNESTEYSDNEGNEVDFPSPEIEVDCGGDVTPRSCSDPVTIEVGGCEDTVEIDAGDLDMSSLGRIIKVNVTLGNVCPHRRVALAAILTETDIRGMDHKRGIRILTVPAHSMSSCRDITVRCISFVVPEDLDASGLDEGICNTRRFKVRFIAHYIDNDFDCCPDITRS